MGRACPKASLKRRGQRRVLGPVPRPARGPVRGAQRSRAATTIEIEGPAFTQFLFNNSRAGLFWLPIRLFLGFSWLEAGWHKLTGGGWIDGGTALAGYWTNAVKIPAEAPGRPPITYEWYRDFINLLLTRPPRELVRAGSSRSASSPSVSASCFGVLTGLAAFGGALMNMSFLLAGSASTNPVLFTLAIGLILAWKVAGYYGVDRYLLPMLGTPWRPGVDHGRDDEAAGGNA